MLARAQEAGVLAGRIGVTGGDALAVQGERPLAVAELARRFEAWLPAYMGAIPRQA